MYYSDQVVEDVRSANNIVDVISSRVQLTKKGKNYFGLCPFHKEKTPSFSVDPDRQYYYCFSCNKGGNVYSFLMEIEKLTFPEAIQRLADSAGIVLPESSDPAYNQKLARTKALQERHFEMYAQAVSFFSQTLFSERGKKAREYMQKRMIRADIVKRFGLGYAPPEWDALYNYLRSKSYKDEELLSGGLIIKGKNEGYYDRFRDRIIFPIQDASGRILALGGRALDDSTPKYLNSPESLFYNKGKNLYGLNLAKNTKEKSMIIVEGYMDLISLYAHGIDNVVAPLGTALTEVQARLLKRYIDDVIIAFDADAAGQAATLRGLDILETQGFHVRVLTIPESKDPDEYIRARGASAFRALLAEAMPLLDYKIESLRRKYPNSGTDNDIRFFKDVVHLLAGVNDEIEREIYVGRIAAKYGITETSIKSEIAKTELKRRNAADRAGAWDGAGARDRIGAGDRTGAGSRAITMDKAGAIARRNAASAQYGLRASNDYQNIYSIDNVDVNGADINGGIDSTNKVINIDELFVVALLATDNTLWDIVAEKLQPEQIDNTNARQALIYACERASQGYTVLPGELMHYFSSDEENNFAALLMGGCHCEDNRRAMSQKIQDIHSARAKKQFREIVSALEAGNLAENEAARLRSQLTEYMKQTKPLSDNAPLKGLGIRDQAPGIGDNSPP